MVFSFNWIAPATNIGNVTMYFCGVAANGNNLSTLDYVYRSTQVITPAGASGIAEPDAAHNIRIYPNPASDHFVVSGELEASALLAIKLYDFHGRLVRELLPASSRSGLFSESFRADDLSAGVYLLSIERENGKSVKKLILE
jgi:hypothetical protein